MLTDDGRLAVGAVRADARAAALAADRPSVHRARSDGGCRPVAGPDPVLTKRFRHQIAVDARRPRGAGRCGLRLPRPERLRQDHDHPDAARPDRAHRRRDRAARRADAGAAPARALRRVGALVEGPAFHPYLSGRANLRPARRRRPAQRRRARPRARIDAALDRVGLLAAAAQALPRVLAGHAAAARHRQRAADAARPAGARRADQRPRPAGHPRGPAPDRRARRRRHDRAGLQPPARRGRADVQPRRRDVRGQARRPGPAGRAARRRPCQTVRVDTDRAEDAAPGADRRSG